MKKFLTSLLLFFFTNVSLHAEKIIFDLGGVAFKISKIGFGKEIGIGKCLTYMVLDGKSTKDLQNCIMDVLSLAGSQDGEESEFLRLPDGTYMPQIMVEYLKGTISSQEIIEVALSLAQELYDLNYFANEREYILVTKTICVMFDSHLSAKHMTPNKKMIKLVEQLSQEVDENGNPKHEIYILSNWHDKSFEILYNSAAGQEFLKFFKPENIIISGEIGLVKPHRSIFEYLLKTYNLDPADCIFIDDQQENIHSANNNGITALLYTEKKHKNLIKELKKRSII